MKQLAVLTVTMAAAMAFADEIPCGQVGVYNFTTTARNAAVAVAFSDLEGGDMKLSNFIKTTGFLNGDQVYVYAGSAFQGWQYNATSKEWDAVTVNANLDASGNLQLNEGAAAASTTLAFGSGVWVKRGSNWTPGAAYTITVYGKPSTATSFTVGAGATALCGNPKLAAAAVSVDKATVGDIIRIPSGDQVLVAQYRFNGTKWVGYDSSHLPIELAAVEIPAGSAFWYQNCGSSAVTLTFAN